MPNAYPFSDSPRAVSARSGVTLVLCTVLHTFTHAYGTLLIPLYLLIVADLKLGGVRSASLVVTVYGLVYCLGSYIAGVVADRFNRKALLGIGLMGNAVAIVLMGLTRRYELLLVLGVLAGVGGTLFHPAANALVPAHFPKSPGMAIGLLGIGSGLGFFAGPQYAGWRAHAGGWRLGQIADWQRPCVELGLAGLLAGILFLIFAREAPRRETISASAKPDSLPPSGASRVVGSPSADALWTSTLSIRVAAVGAVLGCRDFAGVAGLSLASIYLQKAYAKTTAQTGLIVGSMMLLSVIVNPLIIYLTPGARRLPTLISILLLGAIVATAVPFMPIGLTVAALCAFQTCQLGSYAISDAAMLERVSPAVRGRVVGLFLVIAGTFGSTGPWIMGWWTDRLGARAAEPIAYASAFGLLGLMMAVAAFSTPFIARLGPTGGPGFTPINPLTELTPRMLEPAG